MNKTITRIFRPYPMPDGIAATMPQLVALYPKYRCPTCEHWFHLPFKDCVCRLRRVADGLKTTQKKGPRVAETPALAYNTRPKRK